MRVLFVNSANGRGNVSPIVQAQGFSLKKKGIDIEYFPIYGKGIRGYISNIPGLKLKIKSFNPDIIHAHYSLSGFLVSATTSVPVVVSIMGSFPKETLKLLVIRVLSKLIWAATIVKSTRTMAQIGVQNLIVLPNGVDLNVFTPINKLIARKQLGLDLSENVKYILFAADIKREEKNFALAAKSVHELNMTDVFLLTVHEVDQLTLAKYLSAVDLLLLTSISEGSPNIIKEAMACNCPIVSSNVGDVERTIGHTEGCLIINTYNSLDFSNAIHKLLNFNKRTNGRDRIIQLGLDCSIVADDLLNVYNDILSKSKK